MSKADNFKGKRNGFENNPHNINKNGRGASIKTQLRDLLNESGTYTVLSEQVKNINDDGSVTICLPRPKAIALKLTEWAMSNKGNESLKAIKMLIENLDGKPTQHQTTEFVEQPLFEDKIDLSKLSDEALIEIASQFNRQ